MVECDFFPNFSDLTDDLPVDDLIKPNEIPFLSAPTDQSAYAQADTSRTYCCSETEFNNAQYSTTHIGTTDGVLSLYLDQIGKHSLLSFSEELKLFKQIDNNRQQIEDYRTSSQIGLDLTNLFSALTALLQNQIDQTKERIISANLRLAVYIAKRYQGRGLDLPDLIQEANLGLIKAVEKFDWQRGVRFSAYASWWIQQSIGLGLTNMGRTVRLPAHVINDLRKINKAKQYLEQQCCILPTVAEVAEKSNLSLEKTQFLLRTNMAIVSLDDSSISCESADSVDQLRDEWNESPLHSLQKEDLIQHLSLALETLTDRERRIIRLRYGLNDSPVHSLQEIGHQFGISRERVRQIEKRAINRLSEYQPLHNS